MADVSIRSWTISVSRETGIAVRSFLAQRGLKKGDLSKFIEEAVRWRVLDQTVAAARGKFADLAPKEMEALIEEAVRAARTGKSIRRRGSEVLLRKKRRTGSKWDQ